MKQNSSLNQLQEHIFTSTKSPLQSWLALLVDLKPFTRHPHERNLRCTYSLLRGQSPHGNNSAFSGRTPDPPQPLFQSTTRAPEALHTGKSFAKAEAFLSQLDFPHHKHIAFLLKYHHCAFTEQSHQPFLRQDIVFIDFLTSGSFSRFFFIYYNDENLFLNSD